MRLAKVMFAILIASFITLLIPLGCYRDRVLVANLLVGIVPIMIFVGVLRLRRNGAG